MQFGQLASDRRQSVGAARGGEIGQGRRGSARRLVQDGGSLIGADALQPVAPLGAAPRQKPLEREPRGGQAARDERGENSRGTGNGHGGAAESDPVGDKLSSGIAHQRRAGVGHQRQIVPGAKVVDQLAMTFRSRLCAW